MYIPYAHLHLNFFLLQSFRNTYIHSNSIFLAQTVHEKSFARADPTDQVRIPFGKIEMIDAFLLYASLLKVQTHLDNQSP